MNKKLKNLLIKKSENLRIALARLNKSGERCLIVHDKYKLLGTLSDGDVRRALLKGLNFNQKIEKIYNSKANFFFKDEINIKKFEYNFISNKLSILPIVDRNKKILSFLSSKNLKTKSLIKNHKIKNSALLVMAGGLGTRMRPFTLALPKPLLPINGQTAIERIMQFYHTKGVKDKFVSVNYKSNLIKNFLKENINYNINYLSEKKPLGTCGSLKFFLNKKYENIILTNCDILAKYDLSKALNFHQTKKNDLTVISSKKYYKVPYGTFHFDKDKKFIGIKENQNLIFFVNIGIYIISKKAIKCIQKTKGKINMDFFINRLKDLNYKIDFFSINSNSWLDIGQWSEYRETVRKLEKR